MPRCWLPGAVARPSKALFDKSGGSWSAITASEEIRETARQSAMSDNMLLTVGEQVHVGPRSSRLSATVTERQREKKGFENASA